MVENEYAKALYEIAQENQKEDKYREYFKALITIYFEDEDFKKLLNSPFIDKDEKKNVIKNTFGKVFDEDFLNFLYVVIDHNRAYKLVDIKDEYKNIEKIILPSTYNGKNITTVTSNALYGCINLSEVYVGPTYKVFEENAFNGCISLEKIYFFQMDGNTLSPASTGLLNGTSKNIKIYIPEGANYTSGYTWSNYASYFVYFKRGE